MSTQGRENLPKESDRYLSFILGKEIYAIPLLRVKEVIALPEVTSIPFAPAHFLGLMNLRGQVISVVDFRLRLGIKPTVSAETAVIICALSGASLGVVVDSIESVIRPLAHELSNTPETHSKSADYIQQVFRKDNSMILLIDIAKAFGMEDLALAARSVA